MSNLTYSNWQEFVAELIESHKKHSCSTRDPIWMVQEKKIIHGMDADYASDSNWNYDGSLFDTVVDLFDSLDGAERHKINEYCLAEYDELFPELDDSIQCEVMEEMATELKCDWYEVHHVQEWVNVQAFLTRHDADRYIKRQSHNHGELRVYVESTWRSPQLRDVIQAILDGELKLVKGGES